MFNALNIKNKCPECNAHIIHDDVKAESICSICGYVLEEQIEDYGHEKYNNVVSNKFANLRASGFNSVSYHDFGLHTEIDYQGKDYTGKSCEEGFRKTFTSLRKWNTIIRISNSKERRLSNVLTKINEICGSMSFPKVVCETAALIYRNYENRFDTKGKSSICLAVASIFYACKVCCILRSLTEIVQSLNSDTNYSENLKLSAKYYRSMVMVCKNHEHNKNENSINENSSNLVKMKSNNIYGTRHSFGVPNTQTFSINQYISKLANLAKFDTKIERLALEMAKKTENHLISDGKSPNGIAAAYLYLASVLLGFNILQMDISKHAGVTEVTIRNRCKDILTSFRITLKIKPQNS